MKQILAILLLVTSSFSTVSGAVPAIRQSTLRAVVKGGLSGENSNLVKLAFLRKDLTYEDKRDFHIAIVALEDSEPSDGMRTYFANASNEEEQPNYNCKTHFSNGNEALLNSLVEEIIENDEPDAIFTIGIHCSAMVASLCLNHYSPLFISLDEMCSHRERTFWVLFEGYPIWTQGKDYYTYLHIDSTISSSDIETGYLIRAHKVVSTFEQRVETDRGKAVYQLQQTHFSSVLRKRSCGEMRIENYKLNVIEPLKILADPVLRTLHDSFFGINQQEDND